MVALWVFTLVALPTFFLIGTSTAVIGFTAWTATTPLLFVGFGFTNVFDAIFVAVCLDIVDSFFLACIYSYQKEADLKAGISLGVFGACIAGFVTFATTSTVFLTTPLLKTYSHFLKGSLPIIVVVFSVIFLVRGIRERMHMKRQEKNFFGRDHHNVGLIHTHSTPHMHDPPSTQLPPSSEVSPLIQQQQQQQRHSSSGMSPTDQVSINIAQNNLTPEAPSALEKWRSRNSLLAKVLLVITIAVCASLTGFLGFGGGTTFVVFLLIFRDYTTTKATGTSFLLTFPIMLAVGAVYVSEGLVDFSFIWPYLAIAQSISLCGLLFGSYLSLRIERAYILSFVVSGSLFLMAAVIFVQWLVIYLRGR
eukprot:TRINITY_DN8711_c0_g1_i1.p1 TRINITY_DN8711_c0_g1~~TRINITY_DN8711_c0_g1_i1.p1  ORF type:complete len:363 (+),score=66.51 TRINITY_DN8711_c0_g1_i1:158-1246(+)